MQLTRCGKVNCRCRKGKRHGPYHYRIWRGDGRTVHKVYVKLADLAQVRRQCDQHQAFEEELRALRARRLAYTRRLWVQMRRSACLRAGRRA